MFGLIWLSSVECCFKNEMEGIVGTIIIALSPILPPKNVDKSSASDGHHSRRCCLTAVMLLSKKVW